MEVNAPNTEVDEPSPGTGLGRRLAAAREARGLTLEVVAGNLRLSAATLQALEANRYEDLPEPIFVRGYLRAYARLLQIDGTGFVAEYDRLVAKRGPVLTSTTKGGRQETARALCFRGAVVLIGVAMVVLLGYWWYSRLNHEVPAQFQTASSEAEQRVSPTSEVPPSQIDATKPGGGSVMALPPDTSSQSPSNEVSGQTVASGEPEPQLGETTTTAKTALPNVIESAVNVIADAAVQRRNIETPIASAVTDMPVAPLASEHRRLVRASRAPTGQDVLVIKTNDKSWAEVVDADGYQLLYYPLRPGMVLRLQGQAPFRVFLGNAPSVELSLNQKRFDHTSFHRRNSTARFTVGGDT